MCCRSSAPPRSWCSTSRASVAGVTYIRLGLTDRESIDAAIEQCGGPVDTIVSCAGVADGPLLPRINFIGQRHFIERVVDAGWMPRGSAIAMVSSAGGRGWEMNLPVLLELIAMPAYEDAVGWMEQHPDMAGYAQSKQLVRLRGTEGVRVRPARHSHQRHHARPDRHTSGTSPRRRLAEVRDRLSHGARAGAVDRRGAGMDPRLPCAARPRRGSTATASCRTRRVPVAGLTGTFQPSFN